MCRPNRRAGGIGRPIQLNRDIIAVLRSQCHRVAGGQGAAAVDGGGIESVAKRLLAVDGNFLVSMVRNQEPAFVDAARVVELADTPDLGSGSARIGGSSPLARTIIGLSGFSSPKWR